MNKMLKSGLSAYLTIALAFSGCSLIDDDNEATITTERKMLLSEEWYIDGTNIKEKTEYKYNANGNIIEKIVTNTNDDGVSIEKHEYDKKGNETAVYKNGELISECEYDEEGNITAVYENGVLIMKSVYKYEGNTVYITTEDFSSGKITEETQVYTDTDRKQLKESKRHVINGDGTTEDYETTCTYEDYGNGNGTTTTTTCKNGIPVNVIINSINGDYTTNTIKSFNADGEETMSVTQESLFTDTNRKRLRKYESIYSNIWGSNNNDRHEYTYNFDETQCTKVMFYENDILRNCDKDFVYKNNIVTYTKENYDDNGNTTTRYYYKLTYEE